MWITVKNHLRCSKYKSTIIYGIKNKIYILLYMLQNKITRGLVFALIFVVVLDLGLLVGGNTLGTNSNQLASVGSIQSKGDLPLQNEDKSRGGESVNCLANPQIAVNYTQYDDFGDGTELNPFEIHNAAQLISMQNITDYYHQPYFLQCKDIDLTNEDQFLIPIFVGHYNGNFKKITGYHYQGTDQGSSPSDSVALFKQLNNGSIKNVRLHEPHLTSSWAAPLVGEMFNSKINDIKIYNPKVTTIGAIGIATGAFVRIINSEVTNVELVDPVVVGKQSASGLAHEAWFPGILKNIKIVNGKITSATYPTAGVASGVVAIALNPGTFYSNNNVFENISFNGELYGSAVGGIVHALSKVTLKNAQVKSSILTILPNPTIYFNAATYNSGGVVGFMYNATLEKSYFKESQIYRKSFANAQCAPGSNTVGGIAGRISNSNIFWSYSDSKVISIQDNCGYTGGAIGKSENSVIENIFARGLIKILGKNGFVGGLIGSVNDTDSSSVVKNSYSNLSISANYGSQVKILGGHFGLVSAGDLPDQNNFTNLVPFPAIASKAGPFVGQFIDTETNNPPSSFQHYYSDATVCAGLSPDSCNTIGTSAPLAQLLNPSILPLEQWLFGINSWVQSGAGTFPSIPTSGYQ